MVANFSLSRKSWREAGWRRGLAKKMWMKWSFSHESSRPKKTTCMVAQLLQRQKNKHGLRQRCPVRLLSVRLRKCSRQRNVFSSTAAGRFAKGSDARRVSCRALQRSAGRLDPYNTYPNASVWSWVRSSCFREDHHPPGHPFAVLSVCV